MSYNNNRNAVIRSRTLRNGSLKTETARRDSGIAVGVTSNRATGRTRFSLTTDRGLQVRLNGREARTLFRVLARHYEQDDRSLEPVIQNS